MPNGTELTYPWFSDVQGELLNFLFSTGIAPAENTPNQVIQAVKRIAGGNATTVSQSTTLTADNAGLVLVNASAGNITITMPVVASANGAPLLFNIVRTDATANTVTYETAGTDKVQPTVATSGAIAAGGATQLLGDGVSNWWQPGSGRLINTETFTTVGTVTYTPSSGMRFVRFRMQTAGGGGGGAAGVAGNYVAVGAGGGSGVYAEGIPHRRTNRCEPTDNAGRSGQRRRRRHFRHQRRRWRLMLHRLPGFAARRISRRVRHKHKL